MCTGLSFVNGDFYFGRNLDLDYHFGEQVVITPRNFTLTYKCEAPQTKHLALIGMASVVDGYPLYAEAVNEAGLGMAGLNFPGFAHYASVKKENALNLTPYEIILRLLAQCKSVQEVRAKIANLNMVEIDFKQGLPCASLHWLIADKHESAVLEVTKEQTKLYDNPVGVLTNNPTFDYHLLNLHAYLGVNPNQPVDTLTKLGLQPLGQGVGTVGLPGDYSPASRFIKAVYLKSHALCEQSELANVTTFFHILDSVAFVNGATQTPDKTHDITLYSCCVNARTGEYYYKTYENNQLTKISLHNVDLEQTTLSCYPLVTTQQVLQAN